MRNNNGNEETPNLILFVVPETPIYFTVSFLTYEEETIPLSYLDGAKNSLQSLNGDTYSALSHKGDKSYL